MPRRREPNRGPVSDSLLAHCVARLARAGWLVTVMSALSDDERRRTRAEGVLDLLCVHEREKEILGICITKYNGDDAERGCDLWPRLVKSHWVRAWVAAGARLEVWTVAHYRAAHNRRAASLEVRRTPVNEQTLSFRFDGPLGHDGKRREPALTCE